MDKILVIPKGYTLKVTSWENDGDFSRTKTKTVETREEAEMLYKICYELFRSENNGERGVGNSMDREEIQTLIDYVEANGGILTFEPFIDLKDRIDAGEYDEEDLIFDCFADLAYDLMGGSEYYDFRVCESVEVTYSPEDVYLEKVEF